MMILHVTKIIDRFREKQKKRIERKYKYRSTRGNNNARCDERMSDKQIITLDNYFTLPKVIKALRKHGIGVIGTSRFKQGWPPNELKDYHKKDNPNGIKTSDCKFNGFYCNPL